MSDTYQSTRNCLQAWKQALRKNILCKNGDLQHCFNCFFKNDSVFLSKLDYFATTVAIELEAVVSENNLNENLPFLTQYDAFGNFINEVKHHQSYIDAGNLIYGSGITSYLVQKGRLSNSLALLLLSSHTGEAGHNCPIACSAGVIRILNTFDDIPNKDRYLNKLTQASFSESYTGAQFLTEIQGGSDVGLNACEAYQNKNGVWCIKGEKWFCSNANADLILMTARFNEKLLGTKGLGLFLIPTKLEDGQRNHFIIRQLKNKTGTRSMATAEIDFHDAQAIAIGEIKEGNGIRLVLENVLHLSRIFNAFSVLGMTRRAYQTAYYYATHRVAFGHEIINYPLVQQQLAKIKAIYTAQISASFTIAKLQDEMDLKETPSQEEKLLLRLLVNINKYFTAKYSVENIRHCLDILAGNGTINTFSSMPRLLNDAIVCENWEGTHFTLWMQVLRDIEKYQVDKIFLNYIKNNFSKTSQSISDITKLIHLLSEQLKNLANSNPQEKTLLIESVVLNMSVVFSALCLSKEAKSSESKRLCLELFLLVFLEEKSIKKNSNYLSLIKKVVDALS